MHLSVTSLSFKRYPTAEHENLKETLNPVKSRLRQQLLDSITRYKVNALHPFFHAIFHLLPFKPG
jgi:hypothetical protein